MANANACAPGRREGRVAAGHATVIEDMTVRGVPGQEPTGVERLAGEARLIRSFAHSIGEFHAPAKGGQRYAE